MAALPDAVPFWFGEDQARYLIAAPFAEAEKILAEALAGNIFVARLGKTGGDALLLDDKDRVALAKLSAAHEGWFPRFMAGEEIPPSN
jgi:phosphoribosylformylglycinamidine synthase